MDGFSYAAIVDMVCDYIRLFLDTFGCIAHSHTYPCSLKHRHIVPSVSKRYGIPQGYAKILAYHLKAMSFRSFLRCDIGKSRMPTGELAPGHELPRQHLLAFCQERGDLIKFMLQGPGIIRYRNRGSQQLLLKNIHCLGAWAGHQYVIFAYEYTRDILIPAHACHSRGIRTRDGLLAEHGVSAEHIGAIHGDVSVNQTSPLQLGQIIDYDLGASGRYHYLMAGGASLCYGINRILWDKMSGKTHQSTVNIKKKSLIHTAKLTIIAQSVKFPAKNIIFQIIIPPPVHGAPMAEPLMDVF